MCLLESGRCVDVPSEFGSDALEPVEHCLVREILCAVEAHVLEEVGESVLVVFLLECSHVRGKIEFCPLCGLVVVADV